MQLRVTVPAMPRTGPIAIVACSGVPLCSPETAALPPGRTPGTTCIGTEDGEMIPDEETDTWPSVKSALSTVRMTEEMTALHGTAVVDTCGGTHAGRTGWKLLSPL